MENEIIIENSKKKIFLLLLLSIVFVIVGFWIILGQDSDRKTLIVLIIGGYGSVIFFGLGIYVFIRQLFSNNWGLVINDHGLIYDNRNPVDCFLNWYEIDSIQTFNVRRQKIINIHLKNPDSLIDRQKNIFKKKLMRFNQNTYGAPIGISTNGLKISYDNLMDLLIDRLNKNKKKSTNAQHAV